MKERIERLQSELGTLLGNDGASAADAPRGRRMSAAGRARIAAAAKERWARVRAGNRAVAKVATKRRRREVNAAARAAVSARLKARWAKIKRAGGRSLKSA
jgi:hypothetical protein